MALTALVGAGRRGARLGGSFLLRSSVTLARSRDISRRAQGHCRSVRGQHGGQQAHRVHAALAKLEDGQAPDPVTILHLGDSHIATDNITGELRRLLQARFGDAGRGLMMPGFPFPGYRATGFSFEKRGPGLRQTAFTRREPTAFGVRVTADAAGAELKLASSAGPFASAEVSLLTGPKRGQAVIAADGWRKQVSAAAGTQSVVRVKIPVRSTSLSIKVVGDGPVTVLGWSLVANHPGVRYINLGIPGASAFTARRFDPEIAVSDIRGLAPKLVVLGYGTNEGFLDYLGLAGYEQEWVRLFKLASFMVTKCG